MAARSPDVAGGFAAPSGAHLGAERLVVLLRHPEQLGDDEEREGAGVLADELACAVGQELVDLAVGEAPHESLVLF